METQAISDTANGEDVATYRVRARERLNEIAYEVKLALAGQGLDIPVFLLIGHSGQSILSFGTVLDPDDASWTQVSEIVTAIVARSVGADRVRRVELRCATTEDAGPASVPEPVGTREPMIYGDQTDGASNRFYLPSSHPILATLHIDPADWFRFQQLDEDDPATVILGHDTPCDGRMGVYVACASDQACRRLQDGWG